MAGLVHIVMPGIHVLSALQEIKTWMAGTSPAMTVRIDIALPPRHCRA
jgi:hypothetical protein